MSKISVKVILGYKEIFGETQNNLSNLFNGYDPENALLLISNINFRLFKKQKDLSIISEYFSHERSKQEYITIFRALKNKEYSLFNEKTNDIFIQFILENFDNLKINKSENGSLLDFLKTYLKINETAFNDGETDFSKVDKEFFNEFSQILFYSKIYNFTRPTSIVYQLLKIKTLFHYFYKNHPQVIREFYVKNNIGIPDDWFAEILLFITNQNINEFNLFSLENNLTVKNYLKSVEVNPNLNKEFNTEALKRNPVFRINNNFLILNWYHLFIGFYYKINFELYKIYDFTIKPTKFIDYKSQISKEISEKIMFRFIIKKLVNSSLNITNLVFDNNTNGFPDCYLRVGHKIFIIEFKDYVIGDEFLESYNFESIKKQIDELFIKKGVGQLVRFINNLPNTGKNFDDKIKKGYIKNTELEIVPIIVVSEEFFAIASIESYLSKKFQSLVSDDLPFKKVLNLTMVSLDELLNFLMQNNKDDFFKLIYHYSKNKKVKKHKNLFPKFPHFRFDKCKYYEGEIIKNIVTDLQISDTKFLDE